MKWTFFYFLNLFQISIYWTSSCMFYNLFEQSTKTKHRERDSLRSTRISNKTVIQLTVTRASSNNRDWNAKEWPCVLRSGTKSRS
jgi:hypothetical protein